MHNVYPLVSAWFFVALWFLTAWALGFFAPTGADLAALALFGMAIDVDRFFSPTYLRYRQATTSERARAATAAGLGLPRSLPHSRPCFHHVGGALIALWVLGNLASHGGLQATIIAGGMVTMVMYVYALFFGFPEIRRGWQQHHWDIILGKTEYWLVTGASMFAGLLSGILVGVVGPSPRAATLGAAAFGLNWLWKHVVLQANNQWLYPLPYLRDIRARDVPFCGWVSYNERTIRRTFWILGFLCLISGLAGIFLRVP